jgi:hypothetical protein
MEGGFLRSASGEFQADWQANVPNFAFMPVTSLNGSPQPSPVDWQQLICATPNWGVFVVQFFGRIFWTNDVLPERCSFTASRQEAPYKPPWGSINGLL